MLNHRRWRNPLFLGWFAISGSMLAIACWVCIVAGQDIVAPVNSDAVDRLPSWTKHVVMEGHHCNTAVPVDVNEDQRLDVIASFDGRVSLFLAPTFSEEIVLHWLPQKRAACIHSTLIDVDADGDLDWAGAIASDHPFWLENPGPESGNAGLDQQTQWRARTIDSEITGIHCLLTADIDNDGRDDLVINNFEPDQGIGDSIAWLSVPADVKAGGRWKRNVFAQGDARGGSHYMGAGDIDGDGWKEIAVGAKGAPFADGNWFAYWTHPGEVASDRPWKKTTIATEQPGATNMLPADINGDGNVDWVASRGHGRGVVWFENPDWEMHSIDDRIENPHSLAVADFDDDGDSDAATCGFGSERVMVYFNDGSGKFTSQVIDPLQQSYDLRSCDMDGDGDDDLLNAGRATRNVVWYENPLR